MKEEGRDNNDLRTLALSLAKKGMAAIVVSGEENGVTRYALASDKGDIRPTNKALCDRFSGRGGGRPEVCQGSVNTSPENIKEFILTQTL